LKLHGKLEVNDACIFMETAKEVSKENYSNKYDTPKPKRLSEIIMQNKGAIQFVSMPQATKLVVGPLCNLKQNALKKLTYSKVTRRRI